MENEPQIFEPFKERKATYIKEVSFNGWRIKVYYITANSQPISEYMVSGGLDVLLNSLPRPAVTRQRYGVGFIIIHQGVLKNWFLLHWWGENDVLHHLLFSSPLDSSSNITAEADKSLMACVYEIEVINFESKAWINTVLHSDQRLGIEQYLQMHIDKYA